MPHLYPYPALPYHPLAPYLTCPGGGGSTLRIFWVLPYLALPAPVTVGCCWYYVVVVVDPTHPAVGPDWFGWLVGGGCCPLPPWPSPFLPLALTFTTPYCPFCSLPLALPLYIPAPLPSCLYLYLPCMYTHALPTTSHSPLPTSFIPSFVVGWMVGPFAFLTLPPSPFYLPPSPTLPLLALPCGSCLAFPFVVGCLVGFCNSIPFGPCMPLYVAFVAAFPYALLMPSLVAAGSPSFSFTSLCAFTYLCITTAAAFTSCLGLPLPLYMPSSHNLPTLALHVYLVAFGSDPQFVVAG